ncbi:MAG: sigma-70 family RNA polymerase sigma factor [Planctomycetota bacterium]
MNIESQTSAACREAERVRHLVSAHNRVLGRPLHADELDDVAQDVHLHLLRACPAQDADAWVARLCCFRVRDAVRKKARRRERSGQLDEARFLSRARDVAGAAGALDRLPGREGEAIRAKLVDGLTFAEIAARLGVLPNTAKTVYYRGLRRLRLSAHRVTEA